MQNLYAFRILEFIRSFLITFLMGSIILLSAYGLLSAFDNQTECPYEKYPEEFQRVCPMQRNNR